MKLHAIVDCQLIVKGRERLRANVKFICDEIRMRMMMSEWRFKTPLPSWNT